MADLTIQATCKIDGCTRTGRMRRGWCSSHYQRLMRHGDPLAGHDAYPTPEEAFAARTSPDGEHILWTGATTTGGYGHLRVDGRMVYAHRYAWERVNGPIPDGMFVDHICHAPTCVRVDHLRLASHSQNMQNRSGVRANRKYQLPRGVTRAHQKVGYQAAVKRNGVMHRKTFATVEEADEWARMKRQELFGEFAGRG